MTTYLVTGGTGFLGRNLLERLVRRDDARVLVLVRAASVGRLEALASRLDGGERIEPLVGDIREDRLGLSSKRLTELRDTVDHVVHLAALYDMTADAADNDELNIGGTRRVVDVARRIRAGVLHHVSSIAVAGEHSGIFTEDMFDEGQHLPSPYHATKFEAERIVREQDDVPWRVYRPVVVVGDSRTGEMDKVDGPYYFLPLLTSIGELPAVGRLPLVLPDLGDTNVVPVDHVADAMDALIHAPGLDGRAFHLAHPRMRPLLDVYNALAGAAGAPRVALGLSRRLLPPARGALQLAARLPGVSTAAELTAARLGIPPSVL
ncbi:MAG: SDR family oxidoreductase, partial [Actinomycetes bacterium]